MKHLLLVFMLITSVCTIASAGIAYDFTLETQSLKASTAGPFSLGFELAPGSDTYNNTAVVSGFDFGGGAPLGTPTITLGSASGSLSTSVQLSDTAPIDFFAQQFSPGSTVSFSVQLEANILAGAIPDALTIYILDSTNSPIPTMAGAGADYLFIVNADASDPELQTFASDTGRSPVAGGAPIPISAPTVTAAVPEPGSLTLLLLAVGCVPLSRRLLRKCLHSTEAGTLLLRSAKR